MVYQHGEKRARLDLRNIDKEVEKARCVVAGSVPVKQVRFLKITAPVIDGVILLDGSSIICRRC